MYIYIERILTTGCLRCPQCHIYLRIYIYIYVYENLSLSLSLSLSLPPSPCLAFLSFESII